MKEHIKRERASTDILSDRKLTSRAPRTSSRVISTIILKEPADLTVERICRMLHSQLVMVLYLAVVRRDSAIAHIRVLALLKIGILSESLSLTAKLQKHKIQSSRSGLFGFSDMIEVHFREREVHIYAQKNHPEKPCI